MIEGRFDGSLLYDFRRSKSYEVNLKSESEVSKRMLTLVKKSYAYFWLNQYQDLEGLFMQFTP